MPRCVNKIAVLLFLCFSYCFAQINSIEYFYKDRKKESIPDFAALAVLEKQNCPIEIRNEEQICTSRFKIIRFLDTKSDVVKKDYLEAKGKPVFPYFRHRPILIFGSYKNGNFQIEGYEETREYFSSYNCNVEDCIGGQYINFSPFVGLLGDVYAFHSIGTPYYDIKNLDSIDMLFYNEYLISDLRLQVEAAGKDFNELQRRLTQNRKPIKATKIKNGFAALGVIKKMHPANDSKQANLYELNVLIETIFKNEAKINSNTAIFID